MSRGDVAELALRVLMEVGIVAGLAAWGFRTGSTSTSRALLAVGAPLVGFGFWGAVDFRGAGRLAEPLRLAQELAVSGVAAGAWYAAGQPILAGALAGDSVVYHALVYARGGRLLERAA